MVRFDFLANAKCSAAILVDTPIPVFNFKEIVCGQSILSKVGPNNHVSTVSTSVPTDRRSFRTSPKKILEDRSVQDLKIAKRTSKDLFFDPGTIIRFFKMDSLEF